MSWLEELFGKKPSEAENINEPVKSSEPKDENQNEQVSSQSEIVSESATSKANYL